MGTISLDKKDIGTYWNFIKDADNQTKLSLIAMLSSSMNGGEKGSGLPSVRKGRRLSAMSDDAMEREMQGAPVPIECAEETSIADLVNVNSGRLVKGLEKWL